MELKRELGTIGVFAMATGAMISSGLFVLPTIVYGEAGPAFVLSYLVAAIALLPSLLCKAELMTAMPKAGGTYYHVDRSFGPAVGMIGGTANWAALAAKSAFALIGIGTFAAYISGEVGFLPGILEQQWMIKAVAVLFCIIFTVLNITGTKHAGRLQLFLVAGLLAVLGIYVIWGGISVEAEKFREGFFEKGIAPIFVGAAMVFMAFGGITQIANLAEEVRKPKRDLVRGMFLAYIVVSAIYVLATLVTVGLLPYAPEEWSWAPFSQGARVFSGLFGWSLLGLAAMAAYMTTGNAGILTASRSLMAMSQDDLVPGSVGEVSEKWKTPVKAILLTSAFITVAIVALPLGLFVKAGSAMIIMLLIFECLSVILMRESGISNYKPTWHAPFYPWLQIVGIGIYGIFLVELGSIPLLIAAGILIAAELWHLRSSSDVNRESALVRLAARIASVDFDDHNLEDELAKIVRERDSEELSRFYKLIGDCPVIDIPDAPRRDEVLGEIAGKLSPAAGVEEGLLLDMLIQREELASTVVGEGIAVPHVINDAVQQFSIALVRVAGGTSFSSDSEPVKALFAVTAPPEEHDFYLSVLVAISETTQRPDFKEEWMEAETAEQLREIVMKNEQQD